MRVISGTARGRTLRAPRSGAIRPTSDRAKEAMFDILGSLGAVENAAVLDLFAGSGALGIEALSRGAASVTFVEQEQRVLEAIGANLDHVGLGSHPGVRLVRSEALGYLARATQRFDLALCDPPYQFSRWDDLLAALPADLAVLESSRPVAPPPNFMIRKVYRYGTTLLTVLMARPGDAEGDRT